MAESDDDMLLRYYMQRAFTADEIKGRKLLIFSEPKIGKTTLAAKLGTSILYITDETDGILSLQNHPELLAKSVANVFDGDDFGTGMGYKRLQFILRMCDEGKYINKKTGTPVDVVCIDTVSGIVQTRMHLSVERGELKTDKGKLADNIPTQPHYLLSEQNFLPVMQTIAKMKNCTVVLNSHLRTGTKDVPGASTRADLHGAAYKAVAKYVSVIGYMHLDANGNRLIRVMPGQMIGAGSRLNFGKPIVTDDEFVEKFLQWKGQQ